MTVEPVDAGRLYIPGLSGLYEAVTPYGYDLMRAVFGLMLMPHGYEKLFQGKPPVQRMVDLHLPHPELWAYWIGGLEFFGGALLAVGLLTRIVAVMFTVEMAVICFGVLWPTYAFSSKGFEYPLMMGLFAIGFACGGGGRHSADRLIGWDFPNLPGLYQTLAPYSIPIIRLAVAGALFTHGWAKLVEGPLPTGTMAKLGLPMADTVALFIGLLEFVGPILLALGLFTRLVAAMIFVEMMVISFCVLYPVYDWGSKGYEYTLMMGLVCLGLAMNGGGRFSLDRRLKKEL